MHEFDAVSVSSYDAASLAAKLTEKARDGWEVVSIVAAGSDVVAYLKKGSGDTGHGSGATGDSMSSTSADTATAAASGAAMGASGDTGWDAGSRHDASEPAGWGSAPDSGSSSSSSGSGGWGTSDSAQSWGGSTSSGGGDSSSAGSGWSAGAGTSSTAGAGSAASSGAGGGAAQPTVGPGWYADPAGRYELRYWDGSAWTEHVSRAGQQYTDPPVA